MASLEDVKKRIELISVESFENCHRKSFKEVIGVYPCSLLEDFKKKLN